MDLGLTDKVAIVTGSARGIGKSIVARLLDEGTKCVITDINEEGCLAAAEEFVTRGGDCIAVAGDITKAEDTERIVQSCIGKYERVDILVNNAGVTRDNYLSKMSEADFDLVVEVILKGTFLMTKSVMPHMMGQSYGRIVNISSRAYLGNPGQCNYAAAKAGVIGFTKSIANESGRYNITSNAVVPGFIETEMIQALPSFEKIREAAIAAAPLHRTGEPRDIADAVAFLASEKARYISGEAFHVTGGRY